MKISDELAQTIVDHFADIAEGRSTELACYNDLDAGYIAGRKSAANAIRAELTDIGLSFPFWTTDLPAALAVEQDMSTAEPVIDRLHNAREWLKKRWELEHPNEGHVKMLAEYAAALSAEPVSEHAKNLRSVAAILATERVQGWANPLVLTLLNVADKIDGTQSASEHRDYGMVRDLYDDAVKQRNDMIKALEKAMKAMKEAAGFLEIVAEELHDDITRVQAIFMAKNLRSLLSGDTSNG